MTVFVLKSTDELKSTVGENKGKEKLVNLELCVGGGAWLINFSKMKCFRASLISTERSVRTGGTHAHGEMFEPQAGHCEMPEQIHLT